MCHIYPSCSYLASNYFDLSLKSLHLSNWPSPLESFHSLPSQPCILFSDKGSHMSTHPLISPSASLVSVSISHITILLMPLLRTPHFLHFGGSSSINFNTFIPGEWIIWWCTLVPSFVIIWCLGLSKGNPHFPLN